MSIEIKNNENWNQAVESYMRGFHTWSNDSVLCYIQPLKQNGIRLCVKDYPQGRFLENVLIGEKQAEVIPKAHAYDDSYTELHISWEKNEFTVMTASCGDDLVALVVTEDERRKPSTLLIQGLSLYNGGSVVRKVDSVLYLDDTPVYTTEPENGELYVSLHSPYLAVPMKNDIGISTGKQRTLAEIRAIIDENRAAYEKTLDRFGEKKELYKAMQICQAWDTIYDPVLKTPITTVSRMWNKFWGGYVLFDWDTYFGALMQSLDNKILAYCNVFAITEGAAKEGFIPNFTCHDGLKSFDRSQPPVGSMVSLEIYHRYQETWFLERIYGRLLRWNQWFFENRQTENQLMTWGSNPIEPFWDSRFETAESGVHNWLGASLESGLDNSPMYENVPFDAEKNILKLDDVGLTGLYIEDCYCLAEIAKILGHTEDADNLIARAACFEEHMESLWDEESGWYLNRRTDTGEFMHRMTPFHFHALFSRKISPARVRRMIEEHMYNPEEFWTNYPLPSTSKKDSYYVQNDYWRGRTWAPMNFLVFAALRRCGEEEACQKLAERSGALILKEWLEHGHVHENYNPDSGEGCHSPKNNSDPFYHWGGLLAYISLI